MVLNDSTDRPGELVSLKVVVAGGFGVGKTTTVTAISEIKPLLTETLLTEASRPVDDLTHVAGKRTTTAVMDVGRITLAEEGIRIHLFGTPGQERFWFVWDRLSYGAIGAVILVDTRRLADSFDAIAYFEQRQVPFLIAVNDFDGADRYPEEEVRAALEIPGHVPVLRFDARTKHAGIRVLKALVHHALARTPAPA